MEEGGGWESGSDVIRGIVETSQHILQKGERGNDGHVLETFIKRYIRRAFSQPLISYCRARSWPGDGYAISVK